jgi:tRNA pseudouridine55 synthase
VIDGFLVIDKPVGVTSHDVVQSVRRWAKQRRVGHLGTLDPLATGVLPIALGEATKLSQLLTHGDKVYRGQIYLGVETTTYDREGEPGERFTGELPGREQVAKALANFEGEIRQVPPPYSAVKRGGEAAYVRARRGEEVELEARTVTLYRVQLLSYEPPLFEIEVHCTAGTYLRSLAHDLGKLLGTGAHLHELCRLKSGPFTIEQSVKLDDLPEKGQERVIPMAAATGLPSLEVDARIARRLGQGIQVVRHELRGAPVEGTVQLLHQGRLVALAELHRGLPQVRTLRVFLEGTKS